MKYLLDQHELDALHKMAAARSVENVAALQRACTLAAIHTPIKVDWRTGERPWGCILDAASDPGYCDECPVQKECPHTSKRWSK